MLSIARALMLNPSLLVLDEPSEGLAPIIVQQIIEALKNLKSEGLSILLVEQNLRTALALGDRHHVLNKGEICYTAVQPNWRRTTRSYGAISRSEPLARTRPEAP